MRLHDIYDLSANINATFVLDNLQEFRTATIHAAVDYVCRGGTEKGKPGFCQSGSMVECGKRHQSDSRLLTPIRSVQDLMNAEIPSLQEIFDPILQFPAVLLLLLGISAVPAKLCWPCRWRLAATCGKDLFNWRCDKKCSSVVSRF